MAPLKESTSITTNLRQSSLDDYGMKTAPSTASSRWNPKNWSRRTLIVAAVVVVVVIVAVIVGAVEGTKNAAYPDYTKLTYSLQDTFAGENFFDNFNYFDGYDPSAGFVQYVSSLYLPLPATH